MGTVPYIMMRSWMAIMIMAWLTLFQKVFVSVEATFNYKDALTKSIIFLEAQRSGKLPPNHRPQWRGDSGLDDGKLVNMDLVGGYYDAGDNVKFGLPMAFTVTTLAWGALAYQKELRDTDEVRNMHSAIKWGTDYFLKTSSKKNRLYVMVGDPHQDHRCWVRPENMKTPRTVKMIDENNPGTEIAAETSAAMAASSIVFRQTDRSYSDSLLDRAKMLFEFANKRKQTFHGECPFYCSHSGYNDELLWAATWLYKATKEPRYLKYILEEAKNAGGVAEFSWDLKYAGAQILLTKLHFEGVKDLESYKGHADNFICVVLPDSPYSRVFVTPGGMINLREGANTQYVTSTAFLFSVYSDFLAEHNKKVQCGSKTFDSTRLMAFAKQQIDYLLGSNPKKRSYMVGFGQNPPVQAHHRGASISAKSNKNGTASCATTFAEWYGKDEPNPNELTGAFLGGPDRVDNFLDKRWNSTYTEPCTYINSVAIGVLAKLAAST